MLGATAASAGDETAGANATPPVYKLAKGSFGITPGAGFFLDETHLYKGLNDFKAIGAHWIRSTIPWAGFQPYDPLKVPAGQPKYNWKNIDQFISQIHAPQYNGRFELIVTVDNPPAWAKVRGRIGHIPCAMQAPFDLASYARAAAALAQHLKNTAHVFEIENSPNIGLRSATHDNVIAVWPHPNPCGYAHLMKLTTTAVHTAKVGASVLVGGIGGIKDIPGQRIAADNFVADLYANGAAGAFDGIAYHAYSTPELPCAPTKPICVFDPNPSRKDPYGMKNGWDRMLNVRNMMVAHGDSAKKIWITEFGGPTAGPRGSTKVLTDAQQSALLTAGFQRASQYSWAGPLCWFTYYDDAGNPQTAPNGDFMGLLRNDGSHKPAYGTYQHLTTIAQ